MQERELTLKDVENALEEAWKDCPKIELFGDNLIHVYANGENWDLIMNKDVFEEEMNFRIWKDVELHRDMVDFFEEICSYKNKEDTRGAV